MMISGTHKNDFDFIENTDNVGADQSQKSSHVSHLLQNVAQKLETASNISVSSRNEFKSEKTLRFTDDLYFSDGTCSPPSVNCCSTFSSKAQVNRLNESRQEVRDLWSTQVEFFLSCLGYIIGVGNTLRFPSMIFRYGGTFFIPYIFCMAVLGLPLVYMHLCIGQYTGLSASGAFTRMMPLASGIGWALVLLAVPVAIYYNIIVAWSLYYFWYSFIGIFAEMELSWNKCKTEWVTKYNCCELVLSNCYENVYAMTSTEAFFHYHVLNRTLMADPQMGSIQTHLLLALFFAWVLVALGVFKGLGSIGWAVTFTATIPYLLLIILLLRGISLVGAFSGLEFLFAPDLGSLWSLAIWKSAAEQVFYSLGIDAGPLISMASFSRYRNNIYRDAALFIIIDIFTSLLCALVIFSFIGFLATQKDKHITDILKHESLYVSFTVYPAVTSFMECGYLWAFLFFAMLTLSALDAEFAWLEMIATSITNCLGCTEYQLERRILIILCVIFFFLGIPLTAQGGIFIFHAIENLNANWNAFSLSLLQVIIICYIYGVDNFLDDIRDMMRINKGDEVFYSSAPAPSSSSGIMVNETVLSNMWPKPLIVWWRIRYFFSATGPYVRWCWCFFCPTILALLLVMSVWSYEPITFNIHRLPVHYEVIAWIAMIGPLLIMPAIIGCTIYNAKVSGKPIKSILSTANWKNKPLEENSATWHTKNNEEDDYWYIDPLSRNASAKSNKCFPKINITYVDNNGVENNVDDPKNEDDYARKREKLQKIEKEVTAATNVRVATLSAIFSAPSSSSEIVRANKRADEEVVHINSGEVNFSEDREDVVVEVVDDDLESTTHLSAFSSYRKPNLQREIVEEKDDASDYRLPGRIGDYEKQNSQKKNRDLLSTNTMASKSNSTTLNIVPKILPNPTINTGHPNNAITKKPAAISVGRNASFLFGPPPQMTADIVNSTNSQPLPHMIVNPKVRRIKSRLDRRSDQRKNRAFRDFNFIEMIEFQKSPTATTETDYIGPESKKATFTQSETRMPVEKPKIEYNVAKSVCLDEDTTNTFKFNMTSEKFDIPVTIANSISSSLTDLRASPVPMTREKLSQSLNTPLSPSVISAHLELKRPTPIFK